jgi:hypothetical protein
MFEALDAALTEFLESAADVAVSAGRAAAAGAGAALVGAGRSLFNAGQSLQQLGRGAAEPAAAPAARALLAVDSADIKKLVFMALSFVATYYLQNSIMALLRDTTDKHDVNAPPSSSNSIAAPGGGGGRIALTKLEMDLARSGLVDAAASGAGADFADVGGLDAQVAELREQVVLPLERPALIAHSRVLGKPTGLLLYGPPGTGKTLLAAALARASRARFLTVAASSLESKWVGESVRLIAAAFSLARKIAPCIVFIDEIDGMFPSRSRGLQDAHRAECTTTFLKEWEGLAAGEGARAAAGAWVLVVGATNRPFDLDAAVLRRLPRQVLVPLPSEAARADILAKLLAREKVAPDFSAAAVAALTDGYSGSDLRELVRQAAWAPVRDALRDAGAAADADAPLDVRGITTDDALDAIATAPRTGAAAAAYQSAQHPPPPRAPPCPQP